MLDGFWVDGILIPRTRSVVEFPAGVFRSPIILLAMVMDNPAETRIPFTDPVAPDAVKS